MCERRPLVLERGSLRFVRSSSVTAYGIDGSQGELSALLVRSVSDLYKAGYALRTKSNISNSV